MLDLRMHIPECLEGGMKEASYATQERREEMPLLQCGSFATTLTHMKVGWFETTHRSLLAGQQLHDSREAVVMPTDLKVKCSKPNTSKLPLLSKGLERNPGM